MIRNLDDVFAEGILKRAKNLAWDALSKKDQKAFLKAAKAAHYDHYVALAEKCLREATDAFSEPGFVSRADPQAYLSDNTVQNQKSSQKRKKRKR